MHIAWVIFTVAAPLFAAATSVYALRQSRIALAPVALGGPAVTDEPAVTQTRYKWRRLRAWIFCGFIAAVIPVGFVWYARAQESLEVGFTDLLGNGDLIIISLVLILGALGEIYLDARSGNFTGWHGATTLGSIAALVCGSFIYGNNLCFNCDEHHIHTKHTDWVADASAAALAVAFLVGIGSILLSSREGT